MTWAALWFSREEATLLPHLTCCPTPIKCCKTPAVRRSLLDRLVPSTPMAANASAELVGLRLCWPRRKKTKVKWRYQIYKGVLGCSYGDIFTAICLLKVTKSLLIYKIFCMQWLPLCTIHVEWNYLLEINLPPWNFAGTFCTTPPSFRGILSPNALRSSWSTPVEFEGNKKRTSLGCELPFFPFWRISENIWDLLEDGMSMSNVSQHSTGSKATVCHLKISNHGYDVTRKVFQSSFKTHLRNLDRKQIETSD